MYACMYILYGWAVTKPNKTNVQENLKVLELVCVFLLALFLHFRVLRIMVKCTTRFFRTAYGRLYFLELQCTLYILIQELI